ncbi:serine hydrolase domain-containing protein [Winogradskyella flava]|uniref:serine hydrolase domain-containing protein n=1 Tax=Winogradskyella flava TaxID=1884876 RepID=UPI002492A5DD|nr:serine hydrolase domain-containing protein [Winogradskyella flava]
MEHTLFKIFVLLSILSTNAQVETTDNSAATFQTILDKATANTSGISMTIIAPNLHITWSGASGFDSKTEDKKLEANQPFRIASITKTFTAAAILRLVEMEKLNINDPIETYISEEHKAILSQDKYDCKKITVKHCLQHTSGIFDYAVGNKDYLKTVIDNPKKHWTRTEQIQFAVDHGEPVGSPGKTFHYSDTGYVILGEIIEKLTNKGLAEAYKTLIDFDKIELTSTWLESLEPAPKTSQRYVRSYLNNTETTNWDNSTDLYGGGGYFSTTEDLAKFYQSLFNGDVFKKQSTLELMLSSNSITNQDRKAEAYRMGIREIKTPYGNGYMHDGFWGAATIYFPKYNATIAINYVDNYNPNIMKEAFMTIVKLSKGK